ncbi:alpha/beta hydrolase [Massilia sp. TS11]|uniref:alpha/beta hydrolase n=1 Tax=Massilia sp. TS11 TaxID=2908003 RepID=UPI001EDB17D6|nr:alpha/beta hydrolase [Massilia sp. TS11]MCG2585050.1 alpha/beta hydrolase [Massilia sp. TS11]
MRMLIVASLFLAALAQGAELQVLRDQAYGPDARQRYDVYLPAAPAKDAHIILMVHGGAWRIGDKRMGRTLDNKSAHFTARGDVFVSTNYRMLPQADVATQAEDIARVLAAVQAKAAGWGVNPARVLLVGHSAGAHLAALLASAPGIGARFGVQPWQATIALDSAAYDVEEIMKRRHLPLYDPAFGTDPAQWQALSPQAQLKAPTHPLLLVCSSERADSCPAARAFAARAQALGGRAEVLPQPLNHGQINDKLGTPGDYTAAVDAFIASLKP